MDAVPRQRDHASGIRRCHERDGRLLRRSERTAEADATGGGETDPAAGAPSVFPMSTESSSMTARGMACAATIASGSGAAAGGALVSMATRSDSRFFLILEDRARIGADSGRFRLGEGVEAAVV